MISFYIDVEYIPVNPIAWQLLIKQKLLILPTQVILNLNNRAKDSSGGAVQAHNAYVHGSLLDSRWPYDCGGAYIYDISDPTAPDLCFI